MLDMNLSTTTTRYLGCPHGSPRHSAKPLKIWRFSGAALSHLHLVLSRDVVPQTLFRARMALHAAAAFVTHQSRPERAGDLRDAVAFSQLGDCPGPSGEAYVSWRRGVERPISMKALHRALPEIDVVQIATWLDGCDARGAGQGAPNCGWPVIGRLCRPRPRRRERPST